MDRYLKSRIGWTDVVMSHIGWRDMVGSHRGWRVCRGLIEAMQASEGSHRLDRHLGSHIFWTNVLGSHRGWTGVLAIYRDQTGALPLSSISRVRDVLMRNWSGLGMLC